jgi:hypothetical protein
MLALGHLALAGVLLACLGAWAALATAAPSLGAVVAGAVVLQTMSLVFALASWRPASRRNGNELAALCTSWAATIPGVLLIADVATRSEPPAAGDLLLMTNLLWLVVAPYLLLTSALTSPLKGTLRSLALARSVHLAAWLSSSFVTLSCWL